MLRHLLLAVLVTATLFTVSTFAQPDDTYAKQLQEYDRRVAEQKQLLEQQNQGRWIVPVIALAAVVVIVIYSQRAARRRVEALSAQSRAAVDEASAQNKRMIELLESIERNTRPPGT